MASCREKDRMRLTRSRGVIRIVLRRTGSLRNYWPQYIRPCVRVLMLLKGKTTSFGSFYHVRERTYALLIVNDWDGGINIVGKQCTIWIDSPRVQQHRVWPQSPRSTLSFLSFFTFLSFYSVLYLATILLNLLLFPARNGDSFSPQKRCQNVKLLFFFISHVLNVDLRHPVLEPHRTTILLSIKDNALLQEADTLFWFFSTIRGSQRVGRFDASHQRHAISPKRLLQSFFFQIAWFLWNSSRNFSCTWFFSLIFISRTEV